MQVCCRDKEQYIFFLENAGELRLIILRRMKGARALQRTPHTTPHKEQYMHGDHQLDEIKIYKNYPCIYVSVISLVVLMMQSQTLGRLVL
jgi:hypothetical protein